MVGCLQKPAFALLQTIAPITIRTSARTECAGQFLSRAFWRIAARSLSQTRNLKTASVLCVTNYGENNEISAYCCRFCSDRLRI
jgi:hypothetical protein